MKIIAVPLFLDPEDLNFETCAPPAVYEAERAPLGRSVVVNILQFKNVPGAQPPTREYLGSTDGPIQGPAPGANPELIQTMSPSNRLETESIPQKGNT